MNEICADCWEKIKEFNDFYNKISEIHSNLKTIATEIKVEKVECVVDLVKSKQLRLVPDNIDLGIKDEEYIDIADNLKVFIEESQCEYEPPTPGNIDVLQNDQDEISMQSTSVEESKDYENSSESDENEETIDDSSEHFSDYEPAKDEDNKKTPTSIKKKRRPRGSVKKPVSQKKYIVNSTDRREEEDEIRSLISMKCDLCDASFNAFRGCKNHYSRFHNIDGYLKCCDTIFYKRNKLIQHIQLHLHPNGLE